MVVVCGVGTNTDEKEFYMSIVSTGKMNAAVAGETISVPKANAIYNEIAVASSSIDSSNLRSNSISRRHLLDLAESPTGTHPTFHQIMSASQSLAIGSYSSTAYVDISHGGGAIINFSAPVVLRPGEVLRLQASLNVMAALLGANNADCALTNQYYWFSFWGDPGGVSQKLSPDFGYSLSTIPGITDLTFQAIPTSFSDKTQYKLIVQQREAFSYLYINKTGANITLTNVRVKVKVQQPFGTAGQNQITIKEFQTVALGAR